MKSSYMILILLLGISISLAAQVNFGVKGGINFSQHRLNASELRDLQYRKGPLIGPVLAIGVPGPIGFQFEVLYSFKGSQVQNMFGSLSLDVQHGYKARYVEIPTLVRIETPAMQVLQVNLLAGAATSIELEEIFEWDGVDDPEGSRNELRNIEVAFVSGIFLQFTFASIKPFVDLRYAHGVTRISSGESTLKQRVISLSAGVFL